MKLLGDAEFVKIFPFPMTVPTGCVEIKSVTIKRDSIFFAGEPFSLLESSITVLFTFSLEVGVM